MAATLTDSAQWLRINLAERIKFSLRAEIKVRPNQCGRRENALVEVGLMQDFGFLPACLDDGELARLRNEINAAIRGNRRGVIGPIRVDPFLRVKRRAGFSIE